MRANIFTIGLLLTLACQNPSESNQSIQKDYPILPVLFSEVQINAGFWQSRLFTNQEVTIPYDFQKCEETGRIDNFAIAGGLKEGEFQWKRYNDSDVFKVIEGAAYSLTIQPDPELDAYLDTLIMKIAAAQEDDGYLYTTRTINPENPKDARPERWSDLYRDHELYNVGHMYEAAVAHYQATGKRSLLDVAIKNADLIAATFGPDKMAGVPGHEEIEIGLAKLYRVTGEKKYLDLAKFFLEQRGSNAPENPSPEEWAHMSYIQDHLPVTQQNEAVGHAVRAGYLYSGMADVAALTGDSAYVTALDALWENVVSKKLYITGGIGARHQGEAFDDNYILPNAEAYNETCAAIANIFWNYRLFLLHGDAKYVDVLERVLYNGFLSGVSLNGNEFFYVNPLESDGGHIRSPWFSTACCPVNVVRFLPSIPGYIYAQRENNLFINLFINSEATIPMPDRTVSVQQESNYPWDGNMVFTVSPDRPGKFRVNIRIPGWADNRPVPSDLYRYQNFTNRKMSLKVNGEFIFPDMQKGYAGIEREWKQGDKIELFLPMSPRQVIAHDSVITDQGKIAIERGPVVYCAEGVDNDQDLSQIFLPRRQKFETEFDTNTLGGIVWIKGKAFRDEQSVPFTALPYYAWAHRDSGEMKVWIPVK